MTDLSKSTDTLGYPALVPSSKLEGRFLHNQRLGKVLVKPIAPVEKRFLYYVLCSREYQTKSSRSVDRNNCRTHLAISYSTFQFDLPPLPEQRAIAHILGTLDDKIELNRRMNATLEAMARALFKSWFVDFDPMRAKAEGRDTGLPREIADLFPDAFEESAVGEVPRGWRVAAIGDWSEPWEVQLRSTKEPAYWDGNINLRRQKTWLAVESLP